MRRAEMRRHTVAAKDLWQKVSTEMHTVPETCMDSASIDLYSSIHRLLQ